MSQPDFGVENCTWKAKDGKVIKYTKETHQLTTWEDWNEYHLQITKWPKNTSIEIVVLSGDEGYDSESRWSSSEVYRYVKMPHAEFEPRREELIRKVLELANQQFGYLAF